MPLIDGFGSSYVPSEPRDYQNETSSDAVTQIEHSVLGALTVICFVIGVPGGLLSLFYFLSKQEKTINTHLFILINMTDVLICILMIFVGSSHFAQLQTGFVGGLMFDNVGFCNLWAMLWQVSIRLSVFLVGVLSITRVISILRPFKSVKISRVLLVIAGYGAVLFVQSTVPFWPVDWPGPNSANESSKYTYSASISRCSWNSTDYLGCSSPDKVYSTLHMIVEWSFPVLPVLASCAILVYKLQCQPSSHEAHSVTSTSDIKRSSTITVVILTIIYLTCTACSAVWQCVTYFDYLIKCGTSATRITSALDRDSDYAIVQTLLTTYIIPINSAANIVVYFCRIKGLRAYALSVFRWDRIKCGSCSSTSRQQQAELINPIN